MSSSGIYRERGESLVFGCVANPKWGFRISEMKNFNKIVDVILLLPAVM